MPLSQSEAAAQACPVCRQPLAEGPGAVAAAAPAGAAPPRAESAGASPAIDAGAPPSAWRVLAVWAGILLIVLVVGGGLFYVLNWSLEERESPPAAPGRRAENPPKPAPADAGMPSSAAPESPASAPASQPAVQPAGPAFAVNTPAPAGPAKEPVQNPGPAPAAPAAPPVAAPAETQPAEPRFAMMVPLEEGEHEETVTLDTPNEVQILPGLNGLKKVNLRGQALRLEIESLNGEAALEVSRLEAREILLSGGMNGRAQLKIDQPKGVIRIEQGLHGEAWAEVLAPQGQVRFKESAAIDGGSKVRIVGGQVVLGRIDGGARVEVVLTAGGRLRFTELSGGARLTWRKADPGDPAPTIEAGKINPGAKYEPN